MPAAIPLIAGAVVGYGVSALGASLTVAVIAGSLVSAGMSMLTAPSLKGVPQPQVPSSYRVNPTFLTFQGDAPRRVVYGRPRVSGVVVYANIAGQDNEDLYVVVAIAAHKIADVEEVYLDNKPSSEFGARLRWWWHNGDDDQPADDVLVGTFQEWTAQHRLRGVAYAVIKMTYDKEVFKSGMPRNIQFDVKGKPVYDPRTKEVKWSSNPALNLADYLLSRDGLSVPYDEIDEEHLIASANVCDQTPENYASSLCEGRYSCNGVVELSQSKNNIIELLVSSMAGALVWSESKFYIFAGAPATPSGDINEKQISGNISINPSSSIDQTFNTIKGTFLDGFSDYVFNDFPPVTADSYVEQDGEILVRDIQLPLTISSLTAQRIATVFLRRERLGETLVLECDWSVFNYSVWDVINLSIEPLGWIDRQFQITRWSFRLPSHNDAGGITLDLREYHPDIYSDDITLSPETGAGEIIAPDVTMINPPAWVLAESSINTINPTDYSPQIRVTWGKSANPYAIGYEVSIVKEGEDPHDEWVAIIGAHNTSYTQSVSAGNYYDVYVRSLNSFGKNSDGAYYGPILSSSGGLFPPDAPRGVTYTTSGRWLTISWGSVDNTESYQVYSYVDSNSCFISDVPAPTASITILHQPFDVRYSVRALSAAGGESSDVFIDVAGRQADLLISVRSLSDLEDIDGFVVYKHRVLVPQSRVLASDLEWEIFNTAIPEQVDESVALSSPVTYHGAAHLDGLISAKYGGTKKAIKSYAVGKDTSGFFYDGRNIDGNVQIGIKVTPADGPIVINSLNIFLEK